MNLATTFMKGSAYAQLLSVDFVDSVSGSEVPASASATVTVVSGTDPTPAALLSGTPTINGTVVSQLLTGGVNGVVYLVTLAAVTSLSFTYYRMVRVAVSYVGTSATEVLNTTFGGTPTAAFSSIVTGLSVAFTDTSTDTGGTISAWSWVFGDGGVSASQNPTHVYAALGTFNVSLTITDSASGRTSTVTHPVVIASGGVVSPPGYDAQTYKTAHFSGGSYATASLTMTVGTNGMWTITNHSGAVVGSGNWFDPPLAGTGPSYKVKFTSTLSVTGSYWNLTNPAAAATTINTDMVLVLAEIVTTVADDVTSGTIQVDITPVAAGGTSTGTFNFSVEAEALGTSGL